MVFPYSMPEMAARWMRAQDEVDVEEQKRILGMTMAIFLPLLILSLAFWVVALVLLVKHAHEMPSWAIVLAIIFLVLVPGGALFTILLAVLIRKSGYDYQ